MGKARRHQITCVATRFRAPRRHHPGHAALQGLQGSGWLAAGRDLPGEDVAALKDQGIGGHEVLTAQRLTTAVGAHSTRAHLARLIQRRQLFGDRLSRSPKSLPESRAPGLRSLVLEHALT